MKTDYLDRFATPAISSDNREPEPEPEPEPLSMQSMKELRGKLPPAEALSGTQSRSMKLVGPIVQHADLADPDSPSPCTRVNSAGPESVELEVQRLRAEREEQIEILLQQTAREQQNRRQRCAEKLEAVETLLTRFNQADVLKLMAVEPTSKFNPPRTFWRQFLCSKKTVVRDLEQVLDVDDWVKMHRVVRRALQPWVSLLLMELKSPLSIKEKSRDANNVVAILIQKFSGAELSLLVNNEKPYALPAEIKEINRKLAVVGRFPITKQDWTVIHRVIAALATDITFSEGREYYRPVDFLRKVLVLCCAFTGGNVSRPMFAAFVSLSFGFLHIRYLRLDTNCNLNINESFELMH